MQWREHSVMKPLAMGPDDTISEGEHPVTLKVYIPHLLIQKIYVFQKDEYIWDIKQHITSSLPKEVKESFNYGLFCPPINGKAGKFLDEQRPLADYPFRSSVGYVELRYKRRVYKMMNVEEKQIKQLHTRANLRRMLDHVNNGQVEKITKMCARGMDPNFHCPETGETPLTCATNLKQPAKVIMALINGGALLDFRTKDGLTALHKAVERNNLEALKTLLDLGASPNYKDSKGLTPLYYTLLHASDHQLTELLLHDHAFVGTCDPQGWQEVHQACKHGLVQHLEDLLFYGADMNARNASGNTPLHVCAVNDQENCARVLLFRGADKNALNYANQNPYQVAVIAGNLNLGELIRNHNAEDVVPYREMPIYNPRRRASIAPVFTLSRTHSDPRLDLNVGMKPPSPCPSNCSLPPFSSISCISDTSNTSSSTCTQPSGEDSEDTASGSVITEKSITSDSSGVCTSNSAASYESGQEQLTAVENFAPGNTCVCTADYNSLLAGHLQLSSGDTVEILGDTEDGLLLGRTVCGQVGLVPASCLQVLPRSFDIPRVEGRRERCAKRNSNIPRRWKAFGEPRTVILHKGRKGFGFVLRGTKASSPLMERETNDSWPSQYLEDVNKGGVADLAGLKKGDYLLEINGQDVSQASHEHVVSIIQHSGNLVAMTVITLQNPIQSFVIPVENTPLPYRQCATLPRKLASKKAPAPPKRDPKTTLSVGRVRARSMVAGLAEIESLDRNLNDYDSEGRSTKSSSVESIPNKTGMKMADGHLIKTASIKARPSSQRVSAAELQQFFQRQQSKAQPHCYTLNTMTRTKNRPPKVYGSVAEMKRSKASRSKLAEMALKVHKQFFSTPDLKGEIVSNNSDNQIPIKRSISQEDVYNVQGSRHSWACTPNGYDSFLGLSAPEEYSMNYRDAWKSIEDVYDSTIPVETTDVNADIYAQTLPLTKRDKTSRASCPPPSHPPPPPPVGQVVKVDVSKALGEYANVNTMDEERNSSQVMSSFRPGDSAKLYASPEVVISVGYKSETLATSKDNVQLRQPGGGSSLRSQSLPPKVTGNKSDRGSATSSDAENSGDSGALYTTFKKTNKQRDSLSTDSGHVSDRGTLRSLKGKPTATSAYSSKFELEDSDVGSPQNYPTVRTPSHEPFIPEPDYESSEDDFAPTSAVQGGCLSTFGKGESNNLEEKVPNKQIETLQTQSDADVPLSPHTEARRAIQEARERLRFSQKPLDKNATVVFISGKITEHKVEKSEIQLHRTEEGRLTGTVVISTTSEPEEPFYLSSPILKTFENDKNIVPRYPSRDAPASEYAKCRQQILSGLNQTFSEKDISPITESNVSQNKTIEDGTETEKATGRDIIKDQRPVVIDELKITLTGAQKSPVIKKDDSAINKNNEIEISSKEYKSDSSYNASFSVPSVEDTKNDWTPVLSSTKGDENQKKTSQLPTESSQHTQDDSQRESLTGSMKKDDERISKVKPNICLHIKPTNKIQKDTEAKESSDVKIVQIETDNEKRSSVDKVLLCEPTDNATKSAQTKDTNVWSGKVNNSNKNISDKIKSKSYIESTLDESLEVLRLQVNSMGLVAVNDMDVFTELVPPPPEFAAVSENGSSKKESSYSTSDIAIAPPPEFSDNTTQQQKRGRASSQGILSHSHLRKNYPLSCHLDTTNSVDLAFLTSYSNRSSNVMQMMRGDKKSSTGSSSGSINLHLPCASGIKHIPPSIASEHTLLRDNSTNEISRLKSVQKEFRFKLLQEWTASDIADWLDSLFLPEYKQRFSEAGITGAKLANMDSNDLMGLGVKQMGHRLNMERSLKRYLK